MPVYLCVYVRIAFFGPYTHTFFFFLRLNVISEELGRGSHVSEIVLKAFWQEIRASAIIIPWSLVPPQKPQPRSPRRNESLTCNEAPGCSSVHYHVNRRWENAKYVDYTYVGGFGERCIFAFFIYFFVFVFFRCTYGMQHVPLGVYWIIEIRTRMATVIMILSWLLSLRILLSLVYYINIIMCCYYHWCCYWWCFVAIVVKNLIRCSRTQIVMYTLYSLNNLFNTGKSRKLIRKIKKKGKEREKRIRNFDLPSLELV